MLGPAAFLLYDAVAFGMLLYTRTAFRVNILGGEGFRLRPRLLLVSTHRAETDVPLICPAIYFRSRLWRDLHHRLHFAARDDLFEPGFFAGFPEGLPPTLRRALYRFDAGRMLPFVRVHPIRSTATIKLAQVLAALPREALLRPLLPSEMWGRFCARAAAVRRPPPTTAGEALRGEFADLLWTSFTREELSAPDLEEIWGARTVGATADLRNLVDLLRSGEALLIFPEGRPSPDGSIGPLRRGLGALVRRGRPEMVQPLAVAYDPLTTGRTRAYVSIGEPLTPPADTVEEAVLSALKRATPLTCGQVVADRLVAAARAGRGSIQAAELDTALAGAVAEAAAERRNADPALLDPPTRRRRLSDSLACLVGRGLVATPDRRSLELGRERVLADSQLLRLAGELASARER